MTDTPMVERNEQVLKTVDAALRLHGFKTYTAIELELAAARTALEGLLTRYTDLVNCGDCGSWNPEKEDCVINARRAISTQEPQAK